MEVLHANERGFLEVEMFQRIKYTEMESFFGYKQWIVSIVLSYDPN